MTTATTTRQPELGLPFPDVLAIALDKIAPPLFNPRKTFEGIDELAASIKERGLLQNLVVQPNVKKPGTFILVAGERRLRALKLNKETMAPCKVIDADSGEALAATIVENLQRQDIGELEEAEGFAALQDTNPEKWTAMAIAKAIGKVSDRFVQQRLTIARGLSPSRKKEFAEGKMTVEAARTLATFPAPVQNAVPSYAIEQGGARIIQCALEQCIPETAAKFDLALYKGEFLTDAKQRRYFVDTAQFLKLQRPLAEKKVAEIKGEWPDAKLVTLKDAKEKWYWSDQAYAYSHGHGTAGADHRQGDVPAKFYVPKDKSTAIVWIAQNGEIRKALGVCTAAAINAQTAKRNSSSSAARRGPIGGGGEKPAHRKEREAFNKAIATKAAAKPEVLARLQLLDTMTEGTPGNLSYDDVMKLMPSALRKFKHPWNADEKEKAEIWRALAGLKPAQVASTLKAIATANVQAAWRKENWRDKPLLAVAIAQSLGVTPPAIALPEQPKAKATAKPKAKKAAKKKAARK
jgi:ParB/RepB/Spo0J family partition protein